MSYRDDLARLRPARRDPAEALAECAATYRRWLYLPEVDVLYAALGATAANRLLGDPFWLLVVGAPGSGKTEVIQPLGGLDDVHAVSTITEAGLLSGTSAKDRAKDATGGLLRQIGESGIILVKDFSGVLTMHRDARGQVLSALRDIYDGSWTRQLGTDGGRNLEWSGKVGFVGACTPTIDRHYAVMGALGERFSLLRVRVDDPKEQARRSLANRGRQRQMRAELVRAVRQVLDSINPDQPPRDLTDVEINYLVNLSAFIVTARTAVERDGYRHELEVLPSPEAPGRLVGALGVFLAGLAAVGVPDLDAWRIVTRVAWDCVPDMRRQVLEALRGQPPTTGALVHRSAGIPRTTSDRLLEDLSLLGLVERSGVGPDDSRYFLTDSARADWPTVPAELVPDDDA